jgi:hypothetical protein
VAGYSQGSEPKGHSENDVWTDDRRQIETGTQSAPRGLLRRQPMKLCGRKSWKSPLNL